MSRETLPSERPAYTKVFRLKHTEPDGTITTIKFYFTVGLYADGRVAEIFIKSDKMGSFMSGVLDSFGIMASMLLQHGVPLANVVGKLKGTSFPPSSFTGDKDVPNCTSPLDLLARWLEHRFIPKEAP